MTTLVVGGHSRKVGKTSITAGLIKAFPEYSWTAAKISSHWHMDSPTGEICVIHEERNREGESDSSRYLAAGAARSFWIRVKEERTEDAVQQFLPILKSSPFLIIESNCVLQYIQPDLFIVVLRNDVEDFKNSARETLGRANAVVLVNRHSSPPTWKSFVEEKTSGILLFTTPDPALLPPGLIDLVRSKIRD
ncbi:MAG: hypothetical protein ABSC60_02700 [Acidobacteriota bacterium]|jgi:hypothetical protein